MSRRPVGSIQWRQPGVARVELQAGYDPVTGKPRRMSRTVHGNDADAERALAKMLLEIGQVPTGRAMTLAQYLDDLYKPFLEARVRRSTRTGYESKLDAHVIPKLGHIRLDKLEPYTLERWRDELVKGMSGQSAKHVYRVLSTALNKAVRWKLIRANPLLAVEPPRADERDVDTLTADEAVDYLRAFQGHQLEPIIIVGISTGLRPCELYALTWADVDTKAATVAVRRGLHERKSESWFEPPKSKRSHRVVSLDAWAVQALKPLRGIGPLVSGDGAEGHMRPTEAARIYKRQVAASKLRYLPLRDIRHTHATLMLEAGVDIVTVSRRLGHSTVAITDRHYLRPKRAADQAAADAFGQMLAGKGVKASQAGRGVTSGDVNR